jgi:diphosphomevalonate decarboxylase
VSRTWRKADVVAEILAGRRGRAAESAEAFAPANIALVKYWGKRNEELNLPVTGSLSVSLGSLGSRARLSLRPGVDEIRLDGATLPAGSEFARRASAYLDLFRPGAGTAFVLEAWNTVPTAAGFASSASGFAALALALDRLLGWGLDRRALSVLARLGSGSACRSVHEGFVEWEAGTRPDGLDSVAQPLPESWPEFRIALLPLCRAEKPVSSREAMRRTVATSPLYAAWPAAVAADLAEARAAIAARDLARLGRAAEGNALAMHATMHAARPPVIYWLDATLAAMRRVGQLRAAGVAVHFTMDAGPNLKLLFEASAEEAVRGAFPEAAVVAPFGPSRGA